MSETSYERMVVKNDEGYTVVVNEAAQYNTLCLQYGR